MFNTSSDCWFNSVTLFGFFAKRMIAAALFVNATFRAPKIQQVFKELACIGRICPSRIISVLWVEEHW
jgi:hypothetical protein